MKKVILASLTTVFASLSLAACPNIAVALQKAEVGESFPIDVEAAYLCHLDGSTLAKAFCEPRIEIRKKLLAYKKELFAIGEVTLVEVTQAQRDLDGTVLACK